jgi:predicted nucleic acid-binding protein
MPGHLFQALMMIVDANVATYWCVETPLTIPAKTILKRSDLFAPGLLRLEVTHALFKYLRAGMITYGQLRDGMEGVHDAILEFVDDGKLLHAGTDLALANNHPVYDCLYLALALERREPLATADRRLAALAQSIGVGVELIEPE